jgi:hypothetical protein
MFVLASPGVSVIETPQTSTYDVAQGCPAALPVPWTEPVLQRDLRWVGRLMCVGSACVSLAVVAWVVVRVVG